VARLSVGLGPDADARRGRGGWRAGGRRAAPEARLAKAVDKLETILQHTQGQNPPDFDNRSNLGHGRAYTAAPPVAALRELLDAETERRAQEHATESDG
jgi:putative hydrolase of HD superfamily